jgi:hypothetical protein
MENKRIKCTYLWQKWENDDRDLVQVIEAKKRMKSYSRDDWKNMVIDAEEVIEELCLLVKDEVDIKDPRSEKAFQKYLDHVSDYFFKADEQYVNQLKYAILADKDYKTFFDQFHEGLAVKLFRLIEAYPEKYNNLTS